LAVLDGSVLEAELRQARARVAEMHASLGKAIQPNRPQDIDGLEHGLYQAKANREQAQDALTQAQATRRNAELNLQRYSKLLKEDYATQQEYEDRVTEAEKDRAGERAAADQLRASAAAVQQSQDRLSLARAGGRTEDVQFANASAEEAEATVQQLEAQLAQTTITAPDSGLIVQRNAHLGDITGSSKPMFVMARRSELELRAQIPEAELTQVHIGQTVTLTTDSKRVNGRVRLITPSIDSSTRLGTARIAVPPKSGLMPGMFVHAQLTLGQTSALEVPADAVLGSAEQPFVYVLEGTQAHRHPVTVGRRFQDTVEITQGLRGSEQVVVKGASFLADGDVVRVAKTP
jgi:multidrug efflux pump subunit AcrA (membrane-fusion protein)